MDRRVRYKTALHNSLRFMSAVAIQELLYRAKRCLVQLFRAFDQSEARAKLFVQGFSVVADDIKAATFRWPFRPKRTHDDITAGLNRTCDLPNIFGPTFGRGEEMKHRSEERRVGKECRS